MKTPLLAGSDRTLAAALLALAGFCSAGPATAQIFPVALDPVRYDLYDDPYNGNVVQVGGFSGLFPVPNRPDTFYVITDRGPAPDFVDVDGRAYKTFLLPDWGPHLLTVRLQQDGTAHVDTVKALKGPPGHRISGLPTRLPATDVPYDVNLNVLAFDDDSIDAEGITLDPWGNFWVCEEYKPSVAMIDRNGRVTLRLIPAGTRTGYEQVPTYDVLPGVLAKRRNNRGMEGIAATADGMLYAILQRPLNNPNRATADASRSVRVVEINLNVLRENLPQPLVRQLIYPIERAANGITLSDLFATGDRTLLVPERGTDTLFEADFSQATDITPFENDLGRLISQPTRTLESLSPAELAALGIVTASKRVVIDSLTAIDPLLEKCEGVCLVGDRIVLTYDNDFNVAEEASIPANPDPDGPRIQVELLGTNLPRMYVVPWPSP